MEDITRSLGLTVRSINKAKRTADFVASTSAVDSMDEIVEQDWDLSRYHANPVVLFAHNSRALPIGKSTRCEVVNGRLECTIEFATEAMNPEAEKVWQLVAGNFLRAVSVGFRNRTCRWEKRGDKEIRVLSSNVLHEISVTPIGANPDALAKAMETPVVPRSAPAKSFWDLINEDDDENEELVPPPGDLSGDFAELLLDDIKRNPDPIVDSGTGSRAVTDLADLLAIDEEEGDDAA